MPTETTGDYTRPDWFSNLDLWEERYPSAHPTDEKFGKIKVTKGVRHLIKLIETEGPDGLVLARHPNLGRGLALLLEKKFEVASGLEGRWRTVGRTARTLSERDFISIRYCEVEEWGPVWWLTLRPLGRRLASDAPEVAVPGPQKGWKVTAKSVNETAGRVRALMPQAYGPSEANYNGLSSWPDEHISIHIARPPSDVEQVFTFRLGTAIEGRGDLSEYYDRFLHGKKPVEKEVAADAVLTAAYLVECRMVKDPKKVEDVLATLRYLSDGDLLAVRRWLFDLGGPDVQATMADKMMTDTDNIPPWMWVSLTLDLLFDAVWKGPKNGPQRRWALRQIRRLAATALQSCIDLDNEMVVFAGTRSEMAASQREADQADEV